MILIESVPTSKQVTKIYIIDKVLAVPVRQILYIGCKTEVARF